MTKKVKLAIIDNDGRARTVKKYPISEDGTKIRVVSGGEGHFMPSFDNNSFVEFPKKFLMFNLGWNRVYMVKKRASACINLDTGKVSGPDPEKLKEAVGSTMLNQLGQDKPPFPTWMIYIILLLAIGTALKVFGVIV